MTRAVFRLLVRLAEGRRHILMVLRIRVNCDPQDYVDAAQTLSPLVADLACGQVCWLSCACKILLRVYCSVYLKSLEFDWMHWSSSYYKSIAMNLRSLFFLTAPAFISRYDKPANLQLKEHQRCSLAHFRRDRGFLLLQTIHVSASISSFVAHIIHREARYLHYRVGQGVTSCLKSVPRISEV